MNWGVIGTGAIVERLMDAFVEAADGKGSIKGIYSRDKNSARVKFLMEKYNIPNAYDDIDEMCKNDEISYVYIASPNALHFPQSLRVLKNGKNVICEKPFTSTYAEAVELFDYARAHKLMIFEAISNIHRPNYKLLKEKLDDIAPIRIVQINNSQYSSKYDAFMAGVTPTPNVWTPKMSGGALYDLGIYNLHFAMGLFGVPESYKYFPNIRENGVDSSGVLVLKYDGFVCSLIASKETKSDVADYIQGEKGFIKSGGSGGGLRDVVVTMNNGESESYNLHTNKAGHFHEIQDFIRIDDARDFEEWSRLADHSLMVMKTIEAIRKDAGIIFDADK